MPIIIIICADLSIITNKCIKNNKLISRRLKFFTDTFQTSTELKIGEKKKLRASF